MRRPVYLSLVALGLDAAACNAILGNNEHDLAPRSEAAVQSSSSGAQPVGAGASGGGGLATGSGAGGTGVGDAGGGGQNGLSVTLSSPSETVYTNATVAVQVLVSGGMADKIELLVDGYTYAVLPSPYQYQWDTSGTAEGLHSIVARASANGSTIDSSPRTVVVDRTPPAIVNYVPAAGATNVFIDDAITATFSEPLLPTTVAAGTVTLASNGSLLSVSPLLSSDGKTVTIVPQGTIAVPATLATTLTIGLTDMAGNSLAGPTTWSWQIPQWVTLGGTGTPVNAVAGQSVSSNAPVVFDDIGNPIVAITESDATHANAYVAKWTGNTWVSVGGPINIKPGQDVVAAYPAPGIQGRPRLVLMESDGALVGLYAKQWSGADWTSMGQIISPNAVNSVTTFGFPAADASGNIDVAFNQSDGTHVNAYAVAWSGSTWQLLGGAINPVAGHDVPNKTNQVLNAAGQPVVAFSEADDTTLNSGYVEQWTGSAWQTVGGPINPNAGQSVGAFVGVALTNAGKPIVALDESDGIQNNAYVRQWSGVAWSNLGGAINPVLGQNVGHNSRWLVVDSANRPFVLINEPGGPGAPVNSYVEKWNGATWNTVGAAVNPVLGQGVSSAHLSLDPKGRPVVSILESDGSYTNLYVQRSNE